MGLGLSTCRQIVEAHGGTIALTSAVGLGTRVEVALPVPETALPSQPRIPAQHARRFSDRDYCTVLTIPAELNASIADAIAPATMPYYFIETGPSKLEEWRDDRVART